MPTLELSVRSTVFKVMAHGVNIVDGITFQRTFEPRELRSVMTLGGCAGILIAQTAYEPLEMTPAEIFSSTIDVEVSEAKDAIDSHHIIARSLIEMGARGIDLAGDETDTWLEERETHLVPDVRMQRLFRTSAGIVFWMAGKAYARQLERDKMQSLREMQAAVDSA